MKFIAKISWLTALEGGRIKSIPFNTDKYAPLIRIKGNNENWSLVVRNYEKIDDVTTFAVIHYLFPELAPKNLYIGLNFDLFEGSKKVAFGEVVGAAD